MGNITFQVSVPVLNEDDDHYYNRTRWVSEHDDGSFWATGEAIHRSRAPRDPSSLPIPGGTTDYILSRTGRALATVTATAAVARHWIPVAGSAVFSTARLSHELSHTRRRPGVWNPTLPGHVQQRAHAWPGTEAPWNEETKNLDSNRHNPGTPVDPFDVLSRPRGQTLNPKAGNGKQVDDELLKPNDDPVLTPPTSARDLDGYRFGNFNIDQLSPRAVEVLDSIQRNAAVQELQITSSSTQNDPDRNLTGETIKIAIGDLSPEERLAVLDEAIRAGVTGIDATDELLSIEVGPEAAQGERELGPRRAVEDPDSWVYESNIYQNYVAGANVFPENPVPRSASGANERVTQAFDDVRRATVLPSDSAGGRSGPAQSPMTASARVDQAFSDAGRASRPSVRSPDQFQYQAANARRTTAPPAPAPSRSVNLRSMFSSMQGADYVMPGRTPVPSRSPSRDVMVDQYRQRALEMRGRSATSQGAIRPTATDFEQVRRASVPARRPADRVSEVFERFSRPTATQAPLGPSGPGVTTEVLGDPLGVTGGSFFSSPLMGPFRPVTVAPAPSRLVRPSVAPVRTRPTKTRATQTRTTPAPWESQSGIDGSVAYGGKQPSTPNARSRSSSGQSLGGSILDSIFGNPTNPWERQHGSRVYGGRDQPTSPNARSKSSRSSKGSGKSDDDGCFITTAVCQAANLPDDCHELTTLRRFRDEVMRPDPAMKADIEHYYEVAPRIVAGVEATGRADAIWADTRAHYLHPAIRHIEAGNHDLAHAVYRQMVRDLSVFGEGA